MTDTTTGTVEAEHSHTATQLGCMEHLDPNAVEIDFRVPREAVRHVRVPTVCGERMLDVCSSHLDWAVEDRIWLGTDTVFVGCVTEMGASRTGYFRRMARFTAMR